MHVLLKTIFKMLLVKEILLGDGINWTEWIENGELYCWQQKVPTNITIDCGLVGFDVLNMKKSGNYLKIWINFTTI